MIKEIMDATSQTTNKQQLWFDDLVAKIKSHELMLETETAPSEIKDFYEKMINGDVADIIHQGKLNAQKYFVHLILVDYVKLLNKDLPNKLAVSFNDSEVLVWAEIADDDEQMEKNLLVVEAKVNAKYHDFGFDMETTIVESSDKLNIPNHYQSLI